MRLSFAALALATTTVLTTATSTPPIALHYIIPAPSNSETIIKLSPYDPDGHSPSSIEATIISLDGCGTTNCGTANQLSQPFSTHGYLPMAGNIISGGAGGTSTFPVVVTGTNNRIIYSPPHNKRVPEDRWGWFEWQAKDPTGLQSLKNGIVALLAPDRILIQSSFTFDTEAWTIISNGAGGVGLGHSSSSRGLLNHYVTSREDEINKNPSTGDDDRLWYFVAPLKFLASTQTNPTNLLAFGGSLTFTMSAQAGDFSKTNLNGQASVPFVIMECATCDSGNGIRLVRFFTGSATDASSIATSLSFDGKEQTFSIPLTTSSTQPNNGKLWMKDSKSTLIPFSETNDCELIEVLNGLSNLKILGDFTRWHESVSLDNVQLVASKQKMPIPLSCYPVG